MAESMPPDCQYQPVQSEEQLKEYLASIKDPKKRAKEEKRLRKLREKYVEWHERWLERMRQGHFIE